MPILRIIANYIHNDDEPDSQMIFDVLLNENQMISGDHEFYGCSAGEGGVHLNKRQKSSVGFYAKPIIPRLTIAFRPPIFTLV